MAQQYLVYLAVVICCLSSAHLVNGSPFNVTDDVHDIYLCADPTILVDTPLCQLTVKESGQPSEDVTKSIKCPETGINMLKIACIMVTNLDGDNGGYSSIQNGGLDEYFVEIYLKSQRERGLNFEIEIYTEKQTTTTTTTTTTMAPITTETPETPATTPAPVSIVATKKV